MRMRNVLLVGILCIVLISVACRTPAGRTGGQVVDDSAITSEVKAKLLESGVTKGLAISVGTFQGQVTLTGAVNSEQQKQEAAQIARGVRGVNKVNNLIQVKSS